MIIFHTPAPCPPSQRQLLLPCIVWFQRQRARVVLVRGAGQAGGQGQLPPSSVPLSLRPSSGPGLAPPSPRQSSGPMSPLGRGWRMVLVLTLMTPTGRDPPLTLELPPAPGAGAPDSLPRPGLPAAGTGGEPLTVTWARDRALPGLSCFSRRQDPGAQVSVPAAPVRLAAATWSPAPIPAGVAAPRDASDFLSPGGGWTGDGPGEASAPGSGLGAGTRARQRLR